MNIDLSTHAKQAIVAYASNRARHAEKVAHIHDLRRKANELETRSETLASELRAALADYKAAKEAYGKTVDMGPVEAALQCVKSLESELAVVQELEPIARRAADDAARMEHAFLPRPPFGEIADDIFAGLPDDLGFALWCYMKGHGRPRFQDGSGRWAALIDRLTKDNSRYEERFRALIEQATA